MIKKLKYKDHDEWLAIRGKMLGGSDSAAVVGLNPYKSRYALWAEKTGKVAPFEGNVTTEVGAYLEDFVAKLFERETGKKVRRDNHSMVNDLYPWAVANVDRVVVGEDAILEVKTSTSLPIIKKIHKGEPADSYYCQVLHYMAVTGVSKAYIAVLVNCREFHYFEIDRDQAEIDALMQAEQEFWHLVETDTPPAVDGEDSTTDTLSALYPESTDREIDLFPFTRDLEEYTSLSAQIKELTKLKDEKANVIKEYMKDASVGRCEGYSISFKSSDRSTFDAKAFAKDHTDIDLSDYYKNTTVRTFKVSQKGDK